MDLFHCQDMKLKQDSYVFIHFFHEDQCLLLKKSEMDYTSGIST